MALYAAVLVLFAILDSNRIQSYGWNIAVLGELAVATAILVTVLLLLVVIVKR